MKQRRQRLQSLQAPRRGVSSCRRPGRVPSILLLLSLLEPRRAADPSLNAPVPRLQELRVHVRHIRLPAHVVLCTRHGPIRAAPVVQAALPDAPALRPVLHARVLALALVLALAPVRLVLPVLVKECVRRLVLASAAVASGTRNRRKAR